MDARPSNFTQYYALKAFRCAHIPFSIPGPVMFWQAKLEETVEVDSYFWLLQGRGHNILVDTGMGSPHFHEDYQTIDLFRVEHGEDTLSLLKAHGLEPKDISHVILTHLHADHCLNLPLFPQAKILLSRRAWSAVFSPAHPAMVPAELYPPKILAYLTENQKRVHLVNDEEEVLPGIRCFWVGGHSPCSQCVAVDTKRGKVLLAGDLLFYWKNFDENIPVGYFTNLVEYYQAIDRIRGEDYDLIIPAHDPELLTRFQAGAIA
jgi:glyoxylase-like metal-dependent hydrolase (beta-lactamase superfamily II)